MDTLKPIKALFDTMDTADLIEYEDATIAKKISSSPRTRPCRIKSALYLDNVGSVVKASRPLEQISEILSTSTFWWN